MTALGVIGGSGVYALEQLRDAGVVDIETPFGRPSEPIRAGSIGPTDVYFLARHGTGHIYSPTTVPFRANVYALKQLGVTHLLSLSAVGSLREELSPRSLVLPNQIIDRTVARERTFFDSGVVAHVGLANPFCSVFQDAVVSAARKAGQSVIGSDAYVCIEGPQFSTRAESGLYRSWGASVIGMTAMPEARLAREAELCYVTLAMITDYDVWHDTEADVSVEVVLSNLQATTEAATAVLVALAAAGLPERDCVCGLALNNAVVTAPRMIDGASLARLGLLLGDRVHAP
jgi:5'-methylthioadenosine phosphorylase